MTSTTFDAKALSTSLVLKMIIDEQIFNEQSNQNRISLQFFNQYDNQNDQNEYQNKYSNDYQNQDRRFEYQNQKFQKQRAYFEEIDAKSKNNQKKNILKQ